MNSMSKDIAMGNLGYERKPLNFYPTPPIVTECLIPHLFRYPFNLSPDNAVWECACGNGIMSEVLKQHFQQVISTDLSWYGYGYPGINFYECEQPYAPVIITNPPYSDDAEKFIRKGLELIKQNNGILCLLLRKEFDSAVTRNDLFNQDSPFAMKIDLLWRIVWFPERKDTDPNPRHNFSWFVWKNDFAGNKAFIEYADKPGRKIRKRRK